MSEKEIWIQHYSSSQKILLVGEGNFSFSACLAAAFGSAINMVATSLDSQYMLSMKYKSCKRHLKDLANKGCLLLHGVDVTDMNQNPILKDMKFDVIVFNFPHAGHYAGMSETQSPVIKMHKNLLKAFFGSASEMLKEGGEVHVTHRDDPPYNRWEVEELACEKGLVLKEKALFRKENYPGYDNKRGSNISPDATFRLNMCYTFKFTINQVQSTTNGQIYIDRNENNSLGDSLN